MAITKFKAVSTMDMGKGLKVTNNARGLEFVLDEPTELGGTDLGMNPVEALLSALGSCKAIVVRSFARLHRIKLSEVRIECEGELDPDGFMGKNKDAKIGFSKIKTNYYIKADNTPEEIADYVKFVESNCSVMDTIVNTPVMEDELHVL